MYDLKIYFLLFMFYSVIGWLIDIVDYSFIEKRIVNRGFLIGPYCPVYGVGAILMLFLLNRYQHDPLAVFGLGILICGTLEYLTSYVMEKLFRARWWDYSSYRFNLNGRICLLNLILFGIGGVISICITNPFVIHILELVQEPFLSIIFFIIFIFFMIDILVSFKIIFEFKMMTNFIRKDNTEDIKEQVRDILLSRSILYRRLAKAFPNLQVRLKKYKKIAK